MNNNKKPLLNLQKNFIIHFFIVLDLRHYIRNLIIKAFKLFIIVLKIKI